MKIVLYGSTGKAGSRILQKLAARGHQVTTFSRQQDDLSNVDTIAAHISLSAALRRLKWRPALRCSNPATCPKLGWGARTRSLHHRLLKLFVAQRHHWVHLGRAPRRNEGG